MLQLDKTCMGIIKQCEKVNMHAKMAIADLLQCTMKDAPLLFHNIRRKYRENR